jgi:hypothetical protein
VQVPSRRSRSGRRAGARRRLRRRRRAPRPIRRRALEPGALRAGDRTAGDRLGRRGGWFPRGRDRSGFPKPRRSAGAAATDKEQQVAALAARLSHRSLTWCGGRRCRWRIEHDYREVKHGLGLDNFEGRSWRGSHHHVTLVTAAQAFLTLRGSTQKPTRRPDPLPGPRSPPGPAEVLDRHLHPLRTTATHPTRPPQTGQNLTKYY